MKKEEKNELAKRIYVKLGFNDVIIKFSRDEEISADYAWIPDMRGPAGIIISDDGSFLLCQSAHGFDYWREEFLKGNRSTI